MGSKGSNTTTNQTTSSANPEAMNAYSNVLNQAQGVAQTPYNPYSGELVAGVNQQQNTGISGVNANANTAQPYIQNAAGLTQGAANPLTQGQIQSYMSPYTQNVVDATQNQFNNQNAIQQQGVLGNAIAQGALGGNRSAVAQAETANQQQLAQAPVIAGLYNSGYQGALNTAYQQYQQNPMAAASQLGNLGVAGQSAGLQGAGAQIGAGTLQQGTQQVLDAAQLQQFQQQQAYPYQQLQWLAGIDTGVGSQMGGTSSGQTTAPAPNQTAQWLGAAASLGSLAMMSDKNAKENIKSIGKLHDGQVIYRFNYKGDPRTHIGLIAQEVEKKHPEAVHHVNGWKHVNYDTATHDAIKRAMGGVANFASGGWTSGVAGVPYGNAHGYIPDNTITHGSGPPHASAPAAYNPPAADLSKQAAQIGDVAKQLMGGSGGGTPGSAVPGDTGPSSLGGPQGPMPLVGLPTGVSNFNSGNGLYARGGSVRGFDDGGVASFDDRFNAVNDKPTDDGVINPGDPVRMYPKEMEDWRKERDHPNDAIVADASPESAPRGIAPSTRVMSFSGEPAKADTSSLPSEVSLGYSAKKAAPSPFEDAQWPQGPNNRPSESNGIAPPEVRAANEPKKEGSSFDFSSNSKLWPSLLSMGVGMMASRSPFLGTAIGEGGQAGISSYNAQVKQQQEAQQHADQLELERQKFERPYSEMTAAQKAVEARSKDATQYEHINQAVVIGPDGKPMVNPVYTAAQQANQKDFKPQLINEVNSVTGEMEHYAYDPNTKELTRLTAKSLNQSDAAPGATPEPGKPSWYKPTPSRPGVQVASNDPEAGVIEANRQQAGTSYNYARQAPYIEKGLEVPEPEALSGHSPQSLKTDAEYYLQTGKLPPVSRGNSPVAVQQNNYRGAVQNYAGAMAQSRGISPEQTAEMWRTAPGMLRFVLGADGRATVSLGTAVRHLDTLQQFIEAAKFSDIPRFRQLQATISREFGNTAATNIDAASSIVGPEIVKAIGIAGAGTESDRKAAESMFRNGSAQSKDAINVVKHLLAGQLEGKERQAANAGVDTQRFKSLIGERPYELLKHMGEGSGNATKTLTPEDKQAIEWANANPKDKRADEIKKRLGVQ